MDMKLNGRVAAIPEAASGIGFACEKAMPNAGIVDPQSVAGLMQPEEVADAVLFMVTRPQNVVVGTW